jgi:hypothetical protein
MYSIRFSLVLVCIIMAISVFGHPPVSNPHRRYTPPDANEIEDLYALYPNERPLHTTVLMAMHAHATPAAESGEEDLELHELKR